jgi:hypothetical protein
MDMDIKELPPFEDGGLWLESLFPEQGWRNFRVGTCTGLYRAVPGTYEILAIDNSSPGNGHVEATLQWFYASCRRDGYDLAVLEVWNQNLRSKLSGYGFINIGNDNYVKTF